MQVSGCAAFMRRRLDMAACARNSGSRDIIARLVYGAEGLILAFSEGPNMSGTTHAGSI
jgi:hypothetical protein